MGDESLRTLNEMNRRLAEIDAALDSFAHDPSPEQYALLKERDALRARAAAFRTPRSSGRSSEDLMAELQNLRHDLRRSVSARTGYVTSKGGGNQSPTPGAWVKLSAQARATGDIAGMQRRISELEDELRARGESH